MRVLLIEDDAEISSLVVRDLHAAGYTVDAVDQGEAGLHAALNTDYATIVVDLRLPDRDGLEVVRDLRGRGIQAPVLILTSRRRVADRVAGLKAGADDYLVKPFAMAEFRARLAALHRRSGRRPAKPPAFADLTFDDEGVEALVGGQPLDLARQELRLLRLLVERGGHIVSKQRIEETLYGFEEEVASNTVEVHIHKLRRALQATGSIASIETRRGVGYRLVAKAAR